ncbi:MAG TPA: SEC-C metal-binding domain-containing protein [Candidatus Angelobacter sp.]|nr:SEC-C metal-binding domain-containing protein [Candidatus Angelobacter sp.]
MGRNDLCPCGSGRKFKRCCLKSGRFDGASRNYFQRLN